MTQKKAYYARPAYYGKSTILGFFVVATVVSVWHYYSKNRNERGIFHNKRDKIGAYFDVPETSDCSRKIPPKKTTFWYHKLPRLFRTFPRSFRFVEYKQYYNQEPDWDIVVVTINAHQNTPLFSSSSRFSGTTK